MPEATEIIRDALVYSSFRPAGDTSGPAVFDARFEGDDLVVELTDARTFVLQVLEPSGE